MGAKLSNPEWWEKWFNRLVDQAEPLKDIRPDVVYDKSGAWPAIKLVAMKFLIGPYAAIISKQREAGNWDSMHFVDVCSGSGLTRLGSKKYEHSALVTGSAIIGAREERFDHYHFIEPIKEFADALRDRLLTLLPKEKFTVYDGDRAASVKAAAEAIESASKHPHYLAFVDLEGFELTLEQLEPLFDLGRGDFMFNYQHQMAKRAPEKVTEFFGSDEWGHDESDEEIAQFFLQRLRDYGRSETSVIDVIAGKGSGRYGYKMVYAAVQTAGGNPWLRTLDADLQRRLEGMDGATLDDRMFGGQQTLF